MKDTVYNKGTTKEGRNKNDRIHGNNRTLRW